MVQLPNQSTLPILKFYEALIDWGIGKDELNRRLGLDATQLEALTSPSSIDKAKHLGKIGQELTNKPEIGLLLGKNAKYDEKDPGVIFLIASNCATVRDSLQHLEKYAYLVKNLVSFHIREEGDICEICYAFLNLELMSLPIIEYNLTGLISLLKFVIGDEFKPVRINFQYPAPQYVDKYQLVFETRLAFDQDATSIVLHRKYLDIPNPSPVSLVKDVLSDLVDSRFGKLENDGLLQDKIRKIIIERLQNGKAGIEIIAEELNLSRRMVHRKLRKENTSYRSILMETRIKLAKQYLKDPSLNIEKISSLLGYTESSSFKRAFKRWLGMNPGQYRKQFDLKGGEPAGPASLVYLPSHK